ncbi:NADPH-dependent FMN reductase [Sphingobacterium sp. E70]|uniref:NADPH-dependent FMN reductase n=1 Tax=Sphingobacterium sp. E70 TaxID=2853439 RepID=UPI00359C66B9
MKVFAFAGSNSSTSINKQLVKFVLKSFSDHEINLIDLNDYNMPVFSVDLEKMVFQRKHIVFWIILPKAISLSVHWRRIIVRIVLPLRMFSTGLPG